MWVCFLFVFDSIESFKIIHTPFSKVLPESIFLLSLYYSHSERNQGKYNQEHKSFAPVRLTPQAWIHVWNFHLCYYLFLTCFIFTLTIVLAVSFIAHRLEFKTREPMIWLLCEQKYDLLETLRMFPKWLKSESGGGWKGSEHRDGTFQVSIQKSGEKLL